MESRDQDALKAWADATQRLIQTCFPNSPHVTLVVDMGEGTPSTQIVVKNASSS